MLPEGWDAVTIDKISKIVTSGSRDWSQYYASQGDKFVRMTNLGREGIRVSNDDMKYVSLPLTSGEGRRTSLESGDVLISITAELGKIGLVPTGFGAAFINQHLALVRMEPHKAVSEFVAHLLSSEGMNKKLNGLNDAGAKAGLNLSTIRSFVIPLPPLPEQKKIAAILSTWDRAIEVTEKLLANSQQQKKALMQQLLTGKKRLRGFTGEWKSAVLGAIANIETGSSNREDSSVDGLYAFFDRSEDIRTSSRYLFDCEAIIVPGEGQDFIPKYFHGKFDLHQRTYAIHGFDRNDGKFLYFTLSFHKSYLLSQAVGSTVKSLRLPMFKKMPVRLPALPEQKAIAAVLTKADEEITLLKSDLSRLRQEKKALMQQLLTGKRRVKIEADAG